MKYSGKKNRYHIKAYDRKKDNLILIGFMGSGKTSVGIRLSFVMKRAIEDTDKMIEKLYPLKEESKQ